MAQRLLEVIATGPGDCDGAQAGGADRLEVVTAMQSDGLTPELQTVERILERTDLPVRVMLRLRADFTTTGGELARFHGLIDDLAAMGVDGFVFGFLNPDLQVDLGVTSDLAADVAERGLYWTFHRAIDSALDRTRALDQVRDLPGLDAILTAGSARGVEHGVDDLCSRAAADPDLADLLLVGGGLLPEHVPWLVRAGVSSFHIGSPARPRGSWKAYVDASLVRSWRLLLDEASPAG